MIGWIRGRTAIFQQHAFVPHVVGIALRRGHANIRGNTRQHNVANALGAQNQVETGPDKGSFSWFVNHNFVCIDKIQLNARKARAW